MEVDLTHVDPGVVIDAVEFPFVGGIGLLQDGNRAVGRDGKDVVGGVGGPQCLQVGLVVGLVGAGPQQDRQRTTGAGPVGDDPVGITRHGGIVVLQVANRRLQVDDGGRRLAGGLGTPSRTGRDDHQTPCQRRLHGVGLVRVARTKACLPHHPGLGRHVAPHLIGQEDGGRPGRVTMDGATLEVGLRHVDVQALVLGIDRVANVNDVLVRAVGHGLAIDTRASGHGGETREIEGVHGSLLGLLGGVCTGAIH